MAKNKKVVYKKEKDHEELSIDISLDGDEKFFLDFGDEKEVNCECGGVKCKLPCLDWCPKFEKE